MRYIQVLGLLFLSLFSAGQCIQSVPYTQTFNTNATPACWANPVVATIYEGFYSKSNPFIVASNNPLTGQPFQVTFKQEQIFTPNLPEIEPPTEVHVLYEPLWICCIPAKHYKTHNSGDEVQPADIIATINPNPFVDDLVL